jgi:hypothetical protein
LRTPPNPAPLFSGFHPDVLFPTPAFVTNHIETEDPRNNKQRG